MFRKITSSIVIVSFLTTLVIPLPQAKAGILGLPEPGIMVSLSPAYVPAMITGLKVHTENPLLFDFIIDTGHSGLKADSPQMRQESEKLIKYFLATLAIPENDLWVNLSPYEKDYIIPEALGQTEMGRDMLAQDYLLKQLTASLIYPEKDLGKEFWNKIYAKAQALYNTTELPVNTFNKVWILADKAKVYVHDNTAFVVATHLKVMLDKDFLALKENNKNGKFGLDTIEAEDAEQLDSASSNIVREVILPEIEKEVNSGKNFAALRQIFHSMVLATWYKKTLKEALLNQVYANKGKINGVDVDDKAVKDKIYEQYLQAYQKGVFNYIREDYSAKTQEVIPRKYFSGGEIGLTADAVQEVNRTDSDFPAFVDQAGQGGDLVQARTAIAKSAITGEAILGQLQSKGISPVVLDNIKAGVITDQGDLEVLMLLADLGEQSLVSHWDAPGVNDDGKRAFLVQLRQLNDGYAGGLEHYKANGYQLLQDSLQGKTAFEGFTPAVPSGTELTQINSEFITMENQGLRMFNRTAGVLVAGGVGDRLGYKGIKVGIPIDLVSMRSYLQYYIENMLALQEKSNQLNGENKKVPLVIMTSDDTHVATIKLLEDNHFFGMDGLSANPTKEQVLRGDVKQIIILKQGMVPAMVNNDAQFVLDDNNPYKLQVKPHGHGDIHMLIKQAGLDELWLKEGRTYTFFFQDTNAEVFNSLLPGLANSARNKFVFNFLTTQREAKSNFGSIVQMKHKDGRNQTFNVEYNELNPFLQATVSPDGDVADPQTGKSPFPANMNTFIVENTTYHQKLEETGGIFGEFINPKYSDNAKTTFKAPARTEAMMQDYAKSLPGDQVGFTNFDTRDVFSPVKNDIAGALSMAKNGKYPDSMATGEADFYKGHRKRFALAGVEVEVEGQLRSARGVPFNDGAKIVYSPRFASTIAEVKDKVSGGQISPRSVLLIDGQDIRLKNVRLDGTLIVKTVEGVSLNIHDLEIRNQGSDLAEFTDEDLKEPSLPQALTMRGYKLAQKEARVLDIRKPGNYELGSDGILRNIGEAREVGDLVEAEAGVGDVDAALLASVLPRVKPNETQSWKTLDVLRGGAVYGAGNYDLRKLFDADPERAERFDVALNSHLEVDFSRNLIDEETLGTLLNLADEVFLKEATEMTFSGKKVNETEDRAVLHIALRNVKRDATGKLVAANGPIFVDGQDVMPKVIEVLEKMEVFTKKVQSGEWKGASLNGAPGKRIKNIINVGIGGSDLGPKMAAEALKPFKTGDVDAYFISNIDGTAAAELMKKLDPTETIVIIASKTFTTQETMQNAQTLKNWVLKAYDGDQEVIKKHFVAVSTAKDLVEKFGIDSENSMFEFWDWVGGRFSVWSAIGLSLATYIGFDNFLEFLEGGREADDHFRTQPFRQNIPILKALLNVWYGNFLKAETFAIVPYDQYMSLFPAFAQQFFMESNGKGVDRDGNPVDYSTGLIAWGGPGTDVQHSFFELLHQGTRRVPTDFIGIIGTHNDLPGHHDKLFANFVAQPEALAFGATKDEAKEILRNDPKYAGKDIDWHSAHQTFPGNRPTTSILIDKMTPKTLGNLIALYEHQIFTEGIIWNIFSHDQWGVQLGKIVAEKQVRPFLDGIRPLSELPKSGLRPSAQLQIRQFVRSKRPMTWDEIEGDTAYWLNRIVTKKGVSAEDDNQDKYRDYDFRSTGPVLKPEMAFLLALSWAKMEKEKIEKAGITNRRVLVARDSRKIEPEIVDAQIAALRYAGFDVVYMAGNGPNSVTPYSWGMQEIQPVMSIFNTASHVARPPEVIVRGFKVTQQADADGVANSLTTDEIKTASRSIVADLIKNPDQIRTLKASELGKLEVVDLDDHVVEFNTAIGYLAAENSSLYNFGEEIRNSDAPFSVVEKYLAQDTQRAKPLSGLKIVIKGAHTPSGPITQKTLENLGAEVITIKNDVRELDGMHDADPSIAANIDDIKEEVLRTGAHFGIGYDLDGDRGLILVPEKDLKDVFGRPYVGWHALSPDNLLGMLMPVLINKWGYGKSGKKIGVIKDVLGTNGVFDVAKALGVLEVQTDAGYVFLKAAKAELEKQGYVFPVYGEKSGHTWLHVSGEIENPLAVAILFAVIAAREMSGDALNPILDVYRSHIVPYTSSPRFQPPFHPAYLKELGDNPQNETTWRFDPAKPTTPPQSIVGLGRTIGVQRLKEAFPVGKEIKTSIGLLRVSKFDDGDGRYADIIFEHNGVFIGHVVFRASSNDPSFVMSYEAPVLNGDREMADKFRRTVSGIVLKFLKDKNIALFTSEDIMNSLPPLPTNLSPNDLAQEQQARKNQAESIVGKGNLWPVTHDLKWFQDEDSSGDTALLTTPAAPGGIELNAQNMQMDISGEAIDVRFDPAVAEQFKRGDFSGVTPVIINITPIPNIMPLLGLKEEEERLAGV